MEGIACLETISAGHKVALEAIASGTAIRKYNQIIGFATEDIAPGAHVHVQNVAMRDFERDYAFCEEARPTEYVSDRGFFQGYVRKNGSVGTRNYIGILTSVNCSATVARYIADAIHKEDLVDYENVDGVVALVHGTGCGMVLSGAHCFRR